MSTSMERIIESYSSFVYRVSQYQNNINDEDIGSDYRNVAYEALNRLNQRILKEIEDREGLSKTEWEFSHEIINDNFLTELFNVQPGTYQFTSDTDSTPSPSHDPGTNDHLDKLLSAQVKIQKVIEKYGIN